MTRHGMRKTRLYETWANMKTRCLNSKSKRFADYGGRGVTICKEWIDNFISFAEWANANGYESDLTIDRIDTNGDYTPDNCRFVSYVEQNSNRRNNHLITHNGKTQTLTAWSRETGIPQSTLSNRFLRGCSVDEAFRFTRRDYA